MAKLKIRNEFNSILDFEKDNDGKNINLDYDVTKYIQTHDIAQILSYNILNRKHFFEEAIFKKSIMENLFARMSLVSISDIPFMFPGAGYRAD